MERKIKKLKGELSTVKLPKFPLILAIAFIMIIFKDALRLTEYYTGEFIPFNFIALIFVIIGIISNISSRYYKPTSFNLSFSLFILFVFCLLAMRSYSAGIALRDIAGLFYLHAAIPLFVATAAARSDFQLIVEANVDKFWMVVLIPFLIGALQLAWQYFDKENFTATLLQLRDRDLIAYPFQTSFSGYQIRTMSIFYSAFTFSIFLIWVAAYIMLRWFFSMEFFIFGTILVALMFSTYNRNGIAMLVFFIAVWMALRRSKSTANISFLISCLTALWFLFGSIVLANFELTPAAFDSYLLKVGTLSQRVVFWNSIAHADVSQWILGTGFVQGLGTASGSGEFFVDNFILYQIWQNGLIVAVGFTFFLFAILFRLAPSSQHDYYGIFVFSTFSASLFGFTLNIVFFEPVFQIMFLSVALSQVERRRSREVRTLPLKKIGSRARPLHAGSYAHYLK